MTSEFDQQSAAYYQAKLRAHGDADAAKAMDWRDRDSQYLRFEVIARHMQPNADSRPISVLDVGCGDGEFSAFCASRGIDIAYTGVDVAEEMVNACNERFGAGTAHVGSARTLGELSGDFDYVIASGTFNVRQDTPAEQWRAYFHDCVRQMFAVCRKGVVFNIMTAYVDWRYDHLYYAEPNELAELALNGLSRRFVIDHNYPLYEVTMAVHRAEEPQE